MLLWGKLMENFGNNNIQCIYKITNKLNDDFYIGQTINLKQRWSQHKSYVKKEDMSHYHLYRAIRKYGIENFEIDIIEEVKDTSLLTEREQYWYLKLEPKYNMKYPRGENETSFQKRAVCKIDKETLKVVDYFESCAEAGRVLGVFSHYISRVCRKERIQYKGFYWSFAEDYNDEWKPTQKKPQKRKNAKPVLKIDLQTKKILAEFESLREAARSVNGLKTNINRACTGKYKQAYGFEWKFMEIRKGYIKC